MPPTAVPARVVGWPVLTLCPEKRGRLRCGENRYSSANIYLPRARQVKPVLQPPSLPAEGCPRGGETLLLAEDEAAVRQSTRAFLSLNGYIVLEAKNGADAVALAGAHDATIELMITDVGMLRWVEQSWQRNWRPIGRR